MIGLKELFNTLSTLEFDFTKWILKATPLEKNRFYNIFKIIKDTKILFFRNDFNLKEYKDILDHFAPFFTKYFNLLEKHGNPIFNIVKQNNNKKIISNNDNYMSSIQEDTYEKVIDNLRSQSIDKEINNDLKKTIKEVVFLFPRLFSKMIAKELLIDLKIFEKFCFDGLVNNKTIYKKEIQKELQFFIINYNSRFNLKKESDKSNLISFTLLIICLFFIS